MQTSLNDKIVDSGILSNGKEEVKAVEKAITDMNTGKIDKIIISRFTKNEKIKLKGLQFQVKHIDSKRKRMTLKLI